MIDICEVGPRDGLQNEARHLSVEEKLELIHKLIACGFPRIEVASFVNPKRVPQMAGAEEVIAALPADSPCQFVGLVLNARGMARALETNIDIVHMSLAVSDSFNLRNANQSAHDATSALSPLVAEAQAAKKDVLVTLGTAFGCPFEGAVPFERVLSIAERFIEQGCRTISLADTTGMANPRQVRDSIVRFQQYFGDEVRLALHVHNTRGLGVANVYAAYEMGVRLFDSSVAGLGGCPFAPQAVGNVCSEDIINMFHGMNEATGVDLEQLIGVARWLETLMGRRLDGMMMKVQDSVSQHTAA